MKCDELKDHWFNAYPEIMGIEGREPTKCYSKSEADEAIEELKRENERLDDLAHEHNIELLRKENLIAELKNEIEKQKRLRDMALASVPNVLKVMKIIQHHKYKRCLAMIAWCDANAFAMRIKHDTEYLQECKIFYGHRAQWWGKWQNVWLGLADKYSV